MKNLLRPFFAYLICILFFFPCAKLYASHIVGADMYYTHVTGNTYRITVVLYGDCGPASAGSFASLPTGAPVVCVYNGGTSVGTVTLAIQAPSAGVEITPVCAADLASTQCTNTTFTIPGIKKFVYAANYTLPSASPVWRFIFNAQYGSSTAGRAAAITNLPATPPTAIQLIDTLNNASFSNNSNPVMTTIPTPFFCLNEANSYNPGAVDVDGDNLVFTLVAAQNGTAGCTTIGGDATYTGLAWPGQPITPTTPLQCLPASYSFNSVTGQLLFNPNFVQRSVVVYNIREFRGGVLVGTCQREMTFYVRPCTNLPPSGIFDSSTTGTITDTTTYHICADGGPFSIYINATDPEGDTITVSASGLPSGATFNTINNVTPAPHSIFSWNTTGVPPGTYTFYVTYVDNNCPDVGTLTRAYTVVIDPPPVISGTLSVCMGLSTTLTASPPGGTWTSVTPSVATITAGGVVNGIAVGTTVISYTTPVTGCVNTVVVTVMPLPTVVPITGPTVLCQGGTVTLSNSVPGGVWTISGPAATIGSSTGIVTGVVGGTATVFYTVSNSCGTVFTSTTVTVNPLPDTGIISGPDEVCVGMFITLAASVPGGVWSGGSPNASVSAGGVVTGLSGGTAIISYTTTNGCGSSVGTYVITISTTTPDPGIISGPSTLCESSAILLTPSVPGGTWSSSMPSIATVTPGGIVGGVSPGTVTISYTVTNACGPATVTKNLTVNPLASVDTIAGPDTVCQGATITLTNATPGGTWSASGAATIHPTTGAVTGVSGGTATITYSLTNMCSIASATYIVVVTPLPDPGVISGPDTVCIGSAIALTASVPGGTWSGGSPTASVSSGGVVTGLAAGTAVISYTVTNACGATVAMHTVHVNDVPAPAGVLTGPSSVCVGSSILLSSTVPGGSWTSSHPAIGTVSSGGMVAGIGGGTTTISYSVINGCGLTTAVKLVTVNTVPVVDTIAGPHEVCVGSSITLTNSTPGGVWSASGMATVSAGGVVTGVSGGTATISYTVTNACGTVAAAKTVTVNIAPDAGTISGPDTVCAGWTIHMTATIPGGTWSTTTPGVIVSSSGVVTGSATGTAVISYTVINGCGPATAVYTITITPGVGIPGSIAGPSTVCAGSSISLSFPVTGGSWISGDPTVATITSGGVVTGVASGTSTISYAINDTCGTFYVTKIITVNPLPVAGPLTGPTDVCVGASITISGGDPGGTWSASGGATAGPGGVVTGTSAGTASITHTVTNGCGTATALYTVTVNPLPIAGTISGPDTVCIGSTVPLIASVPGGTWSGGAPHASVSATGVVTGISPGTATISYSVSNGCGTAIATIVLEISSTPDPGTLPGPSLVCVGNTITLSPTVPGGIWSSSPSGVVSIAGGVVTGVSAGTAVISYTITTMCGTSSATKIITVNSTPSPAVIAGPSAVCVASTIALSSSVPGGTWSSTGAATVSPTGVVAGVTGGIVIISYTQSNSCGSSIATHAVTVNSAPSAGTISGTLVLCTSGSVTLTSTVPGGTWSSGSASASVTPSGGVVTGVTAGTALISYTVINACGPAVATYVITINPVSPGPGPITGTGVVCVGASVALSGATSGGTWTSSTPSVATVTSAGLVTGVSGGTATISYSIISGACGTLVATYVVTVNPLPVVAPLAGPSAVCVGSTISLTSATPGGAWSSSGPASVSSSGVVMGLSGGTATISYTVTNSCGSTTVTKLITVDIPPVAGTITGPSTTCMGWTIVLAASVPGGVWSSGSANATVSSAGAVTGVTTGIATISYTVTNSCGSAVATYVVTINPAPVPPGAVTGPLSICVGATGTMSFPSTAGTWSSSNPAVASVSPGGIVTGVGTGSAIISYTITDTCGLAIATSIIIVDSLPAVAPILGPSDVCVGAAIALTNATAGGTWSASGPVSVSSSGVVTGLAAGTATVSYTVSNSCGTSVVTTIITVNPLPDAGTITGPTAVCVGMSSIPLTASVPGGIWLGGAPNATISATGVVTGITGGTAMVSYMVSNGCGLAVATYIINIDVPPAAGTVTGPSTVCAGSNITLIATVPGGTWSSGSPSIATVSGGVVTGVSAGTAVITYSVTNTCGSATTTATVTVNPLPPITPILGPSAVCLGSVIVLTNATPGGVWSASGAATVSATGVVTGVSGGTAIITYSVSGMLCGPAIATKIVTVDVAPFAGTISGPTTVCPGESITLMSSIPGGTWSGALPNATVSSTGVVTGYFAGTALISYTVVNACGPATATYIVTINPAPVAGTLSGPTALCVGATGLVTSTVPGGTWSSGTPAVATVSGGGVVTGMAVGTAIITYTVTDGTCQAIAAHLVNVYTVPDPGVISGGASVCEGATITMSCTASGGVWSCTSVPAGAATISAAGVVSGLFAGTVTISYTVTNMCGPAVATRVVSVNPTPDPGTITGPHTACVGNVIMLSSSSSVTGTWSSSNTAVATINAFGVVTAIAEGVTFITYTVTSSAGCSASVNYSVTVSPLPPAGTISGPSQACIAIPIVLTETVPGGTWSSSNPAVATINAATGEVTPVGAGVVIITYTTAPNSAGCINRATFTLTIYSVAPFSINETVIHVRCYGAGDGSINIGIGGGIGPWKYEWSTGTTMSAISSLVPGVYALNVTDEGSGCKATENYNITEPDSLSVTHDTKDELCNMANGSIAVMASGGTSPYSYKWFDNSAASSINNLAYGNYSVTVTDKNLCNKDMFIDVIEGDCDEIDISTGVSANGDGVNDYWIIGGLHNYPNNLVQLYDKWGDLVFEQRGYTNNWDGKGKNGSYLPDGTYFYVIRLNAVNGAGGKDVFTGSLLIKR